MNRRAPLWLRMPGRYAGLSASRARIIVTLLGFALAILAFAPPADSAEAIRAVADDAIVLHQGIVSAMIAGGDYYGVVTDALRLSDQPLRPFTAFRLPTLAVLLASAPWIVSSLLLAAITLAVGWVWLERVRHALAPRIIPLAVAAIALVAGLVGFTQTGLVVLHEHWAAPLVALSLGIRRPHLWLSAVAIGLVAALIRETAAIYLLVMAAMAWREGHRREAAGWLCAVGILAVVLAFHALAVSRAISPLDPEIAIATVAHGPAALVAAIGDQGGLSLLPPALIGILTAFSLLGWSAWRDPAGIRVALTLAAYALAIMVIGWPVAGSWGPMLAPLLVLGMVFVPDAMRDIVVAALDTRRVRVHRITR